MTALTTGTIVYGFAGGHFGRDSYDDRRVIGIGTHENTPWVLLAEVDDATVLFLATGADVTALEAYTVDLRCPDCASDRDRVRGPDGEEELYCWFCADKNREWTTDADGRVYELPIPGDRGYPLIPWTPAPASDEPFPEEML